MQTNLRDLSCLIVGSKRTMEEIISRGTAKPALLSATQPPKEYNCVPCRVAISDPYPVAAAKPELGILASNDTSPSLSAILSKLTNKLRLAGKRTVSNDPGPGG